MISVTPDTIKGQADDTSGLGQSLRTCWCPRAMLPRGPFQPGWLILAHGTMVSSRTWVLLRAVWGSMAPMQTRSVLIYVAPGSDAGGLDPDLGLYWFARVILPCRPCLTGWPMTAIQVHGPTTAGICVDVYGVQMPHRCKVPNESIKN